MPISADVPDEPTAAQPHSVRLIAVNALAGYAGSVGLIALRFAIKLVLIRSLVPADFGRVITTQSAQALVLAAVSLNIGDAVLRFVGLHAGDATGRAQGVVQRATRFVTVLGTLGTIGLLASSRPLAARLGLGEQGRWGLGLAALAIVPTLVGDVLGAGFQGLNRTWIKVAALEFPRNLMTLGGYALLVSLGWATYAGTMSVQLVAALLSTALMVMAFRRAPEFAGRGDPVHLRELLGYSVPLFLSVIISGTLVANGVPLVLAAQQTPDAVALYAIALTMAPLLQLPMVALENAAIPVWAGATRAHTAERIARSYLDITRWGLILGLLVFVPLAAAPGECLELLFGNQYAGSIAAVEIALIATLFSVAVGPTEGLLLAFGVTRAIVVARVVSGTIALAAVWPLVKGWGVMGAMVAWGVNTIISNSISAAYVFRLHGIQPFDSRYARTLGVGVLGVGASLAVALSGAEGIWRIAAAVTVNTLILAVAGRLAGAWHPAELTALMRKSSTEHR